MSRHAQRRHEPRGAPTAPLSSMGDASDGAEHDGAPEPPEAMQDAPAHPGVPFPHKLGVAPPPRPSLLAMIDALGKVDPALARRFATVAASAADFRRIIDALPPDLPADVRAVVDAVLERL